MPSQRSCRTAPLLAARRVNFNSAMRLPARSIPYRSGILYTEYIIEEPDLVAMAISFSKLIFLVLICNILLNNLVI